MPFVRRYKDLNTDLEAFYHDIRKELNSNKELNIVSELSGTVNKLPFKSITASRARVPKGLLRSLREVSVSITGKPNDYLIELHTGAWLGIGMTPTEKVMTGYEQLVDTSYDALSDFLASSTAEVDALTFNETMETKIQRLVEKHSKKKSPAKKVAKIS